MLPLMVIGLSRCLGQAPDSISGYSYRDVTTSIAPYTYYSSMEFHADGTYVTRVLIDGRNVQGIASYDPLLSGSFSYTKQTSSTASIVLNPTTGVEETLELTFTDNLDGSVSRGLGFYLTGSFYLSAPASGANTSLINVSTLLTVKQGTPATIGFVVSGSQVREFLVRVVGPSLTPFGVSSPAPNPEYALIGQSYSFPAMPGQSRGLPNTYTGTGWSATPDEAATISAEAIRAGAFPLIVGSNDKSDVFLLPPGAYTVVVSPSSSSAEGVVLIEVYEIH